MSPFICIRGTGQPLHPLPEAWSQRQLDVFQQEFARWMRGDVKVVNDVDVTEEMISSSHLVLFGDPGSNLLLRTILAASTNRVPDGTEPPVGNSKLPPIDAQVAAKLPFDWNSRKITIGSNSWPADKVYCPEHRAHIRRTRLQGIQRMALSPNGRCRCS
jgi:hypothetical protein